MQTHPPRAHRSRECPRCESHSVARARTRGVLAQTMKHLLGLRPYRCLDCLHRFVASREA